MTLDEARRALREAGIENARLEAKWMLEDAPSEDAFAEWVRRRCAGESLQYIERAAWFYGMRLYVDERVLAPRPDTEILLECALGRIAGVAAPRVLDLCTGSGALAAAVLRARPDARVFAADVSPGALEVAKINAPGAQMLLGDLFGPVTGEFDAILCNPPYLTGADMRALRGEVRFEPALALDGGEDGLSFYRRIARELPRYLRGCALFEVGMGQARAAQAIFAAAMPCKTEIERDLAGIERVVIVERI